MVHASRVPLYRSARSLLCGSLALFLATIAAGPAAGQFAYSPSHWAAATGESCAQVWLGESDAVAKRMHFAPILYDHRLFNLGPLCAPSTFRSGPPPVAAATREFPVVASPFVADSIQSELAAMGPDGLVIAGARQQVLEILREGNSCSAWFASAQPDAEDRFSSLHFQSDATGSSFSQGDFAGGRFSVTEPYVARAQENVGPGSLITLNAHGAFFQRLAGTLYRLPGRASQSRPAVCVLHVGEYEGGSLQAQVAALLHEYAHIVGLIPVDTGRLDGARLSTQNTDTVLRHCRKQIDASPSRTILLPAAFAHF